MDTNEPPKKKKKQSKDEKERIENSDDETSSAAQFSVLDHYSRDKDSKEGVYIIPSAIPLSPSNFWK